MKPLRHSPYDLVKRYIARKIARCGHYESVKNKRAGFIVFRGNFFRRKNLLFRRFENAFFPRPDR